MASLKDHRDVGRSLMTGEGKCLNHLQKANQSYFGPLENQRMSLPGVCLWAQEGEEHDQKWTALIYQVQIMPDQPVCLPY